MTEPKRMIFLLVKREQRSGFGSIDYKLNKSLWSFGDRSKETAALFFSTDKSRPLCDQQLAGYSEEKTKKASSSF